MTFTYAAAQISAVRGDIAANTETHLRAIALAAREGADLLVFPELSLTGYEMDLAETLQADPTDPVFAPLQAAASGHGMLVLAGAPLRAAAGKPYLGAVVLGGEMPTAYAKMHVHSSEADYFQSGTDYSVTPHKSARVGAAICADLTKPSHAAGTVAAGADVYAVGALINADAWGREEPLLRGYAADHDIPVVFSNYATKSGPLTPVGMSSIWAPGGQLVAQAEGTEECLVVARVSDDGWHGKTVSL